MLQHNKIGGILGNEYISESKRAEKINYHQEREDVKERGNTGQALLP